MRLMVHSKSTERYIENWSYDKTLMVHHHPTKETLKLADSEDQVIAIGGGSVIDTAKIISRNPIIAVPTTFAGASRTSHAVYWDGDKKLNQNTCMPVTVLKPAYLEFLPEDVYRYSKTDCICHALESLISRNATTESKFYASIALELINRDKQGDLLTASILAADAFEITGTNVLHALSYPLTAIYGIPHGKALLFLLPRLLPYIGDLLEIDVPIEGDVYLKIDIARVIDEALKYPKIFETHKPINRKILMEIFQ